MPFEDIANQFKDQLEYLSLQLGPTKEFYFAAACAGLIFIRTLMMILVTPFIGSKSVPGRIKVLLAFILTLFVYPLLKPSFHLAQFPGWTGGLLGILFKEIMVGFAIGMVAALVFYGIQAAGLMIDNQRGVANAQIFVPQLGSQGSIFGLFQFQAAVALFIVMGGHREFLAAFFDGFAILPIFHIPHFQMGDASFLDVFIRLTADVLILAVRLSAPVIIAIFLADVVLGIANKVAPSLNVFELGFSVKGVTGVLVVYISIIILYDEFANVTEGMVGQMRDIFKLLAK